MFAGMIGTPKGGIAAVIPCNRQDITPVEAPLQLRQKGIDRRHRIVIALRIPAVAVNHIRIHQIHENESIALRPLPGSREGSRHAGGISRVVMGDIDTLLVEDGPDLPHRDGLHPAAAKMIQQRFPGQIHRPVMPLPGSRESAG